MATNKGKTQDQGNVSKTTKEIYAAVLLLALRDYQRLSAKKLSARDRDWGVEAKDWILSESTRKTSYFSVCGLLGIDAKRLRAMLGRVPKIKLPRSPKGYLNAADSLAIDAQDAKLVSSITADRYRNFARRGDL